MEEDRNYCVYVHICKKGDNKSYVGISKDPKKRWRNGEGYKGQDKFYNAIKKYGWDNFAHIILLKGLTQEEAWQKEKEYIIKYDSINDGYNVHEGGKIILTKEMRKKGYITKSLKNSGLSIINYITGQIIRFESVSEASKKTGISEHWFYRYYKREVECLETLDIRFDIESRFSGISHEVIQKMREEEQKADEEKTKREELLKKEEEKLKAIKHREAELLARKIVYGKCN